MSPEQQKTAGVVHTGGIECSLLFAERCSAIGATSDRAPSSGSWVKAAELRQLRLHSGNEGVLQKRGPVVDATLQLAQLRELIGCGIGDGRVGSVGVG